jgi:DNA-binding response OmpR family regulator
MEPFMKPTLLIAERDPAFSELVQNFLSERGYEVEVATDGLDCLAKIRRATPAAVVLDLELLWGGGDGVLSWLREERTAIGLPVILTATAGANPDAIENIGLPVVRFLAKPFSLTTLLESVRAAVPDRRNQGQLGWRSAGPCSEIYIG